jgi:hypothetical protein
MSVATLDRPDAMNLERPTGAGSERTLEDLVAIAFGRLSAGAATACPVCDGDMRPSPRATGAGACAACGSTLK